MPLDVKNGREVHYPANPDKFEFDTEVAVIFPSMARRSIPNYEAFHTMHAGVVVDWFAQHGRRTRILDVGASHGAFFAALRRQTKCDNLQLIAIDSSEAMCQQLRTNFPTIEVRCQAIDEPEFMASEEEFEVINATYVLQFIPPEKQLAVLHKLARMLVPGGLLLLGQKEQYSGFTGRLLHEQYLQWRIANGYTREEIEAKSKALKNAMWPMDPAVLRSELARYFSEVSESSRMFMFTTLIAIK